MYIYLQTPGRKTVKTCGRAIVKTECRDGHGEIKTLLNFRMGKGGEEDIIFSLTGLDVLV